MGDLTTQSCDYRQTKEYYQSRPDGSWGVEKVGASLVLVRRFPLFGSVVIMERGDPATPLGEIEEFGSRKGARIIKLDFDLAFNDPRAPLLLESLLRSGFVRSRLPLCPTKTIRIDTSVPMENLLSKGSRDVRRYLKRREKDDFLILSDRQVGEFYPTLRQAAGRNKYYLPSLKKLEVSWQGFGEKMKVLVGYKGGEVVGGAMVLCHNRRASGIYMAFTKEGLKCHLPYSLMWESIRVAKDNGCELLDLDGVYDERYKTPLAWKGLSFFKRKFGGEHMEFLGTFVKCLFAPTKLLSALRVI